MDQINSDGKVHKIKTVHMGTHGREDYMIGFDLEGLRNTRWAFMSRVTAEMLASELAERLEDGH